MKSRQLKRVSLRTVLIMMSALCVWLSLSANRSWKQRRAVSQLKHLNAQVFYEFENDYPAPRGPQLRHVSSSHVANVLGIDAFYRVSIVKLSGTHVEHSADDEDVMPWLRDLRDVRCLILDDTDVTNKGLSHLSNHKHLSMLSLEGAKLTEGKVGFLSGLPLSCLNVSQTRFSDASLLSLRNRHGLKQLYLSRTKVSDAALDTLAAMTNLRVLDIRRSLITERGYEKLKRRLPDCDIEWEPLHSDSL